MFSDRITLQDSTPADMHFDAAVKSSTSTVRTVAGEPLDQPRALTISHETTKDKRRVNTAVMLDRSVLDTGDSITIGNARLLFKISYDVEQITATDLEEMRAQMVEFLSASNLTKLLNKEH